MSRPIECFSSSEKKAVDIFVQRLSAEFGQDVTDIRLFGSKARGRAGPGSDLDILVLVNRPDYALKHAILRLAADISLACDVLLSPRVIPPQAWQNMVEADTLFYRSVSAESIPLLASASSAPPVTPNV